MSLKEQIDKDFLEAYKSKDEAKSSVLRLLKSAIKNKEIALGKPLGDEDTLEVINKEVKQRRDSVEQYKTGNRPELAQKEEDESKILSHYLPEQMSEREVSEIIEKAIAKTNAQNMQDMGKVMGAIMPEVKGKADGSLVSKLVKEKLSN